MLLKLKTRLNRILYRYIKTSFNFLFDFDNRSVTHLFIKSTYILIYFNSSAYISGLYKYDFKDQCLFAAIPDFKRFPISSGIAANKH